MYILSTNMNKNVFFCFLSHKAFAELLSSATRTPAARVCDFCRGQTKHNIISVYFAIKIGFLILKNSFKMSRRHYIIQEQRYYFNIYVLYNIKIDMTLVARLVAQ